MIERWFPCAEVSEASVAGWGSGNSEASLFPWFAKRPLAQARAAVLTSLLPWPDSEGEQVRLQALVTRALEDYGSAHGEVMAELADQYREERPTVLDPFSGRGMIPLEAARYGVEAHAIDYSPMAVVGSHLLVDFPLRNWETEPAIPFPTDRRAFGDPRLATDAEGVIEEVGKRFRESMATYYPPVNGKMPWGYIWAVTLPCQECGRRFPLVGNLVLRLANAKKSDPGQSFLIDADADSGAVTIVVHDGPPRQNPTRQVAPGKSRYDASGKVAVCPFPSCRHVHTKDVHTRLAAEGQGRDMILLAAEVEEAGGKHYRELTCDEIDAAAIASSRLAAEPPFSPLLSAVPNEAIPAGNTWTVQATVYGTTAYGKMANDRQTLGFVHLARHISTIGTELQANGNSPEYTRALCGYAGAVLVRKLRRSTRGATLAVSRDGVTDVFATESSLNYSYDYFEVGIADGPGSWESVKSGTLSALRRQLGRPPGLPAHVQRGSAVSLSYRSESFSAVVTDPPYDALIDYSDASDLFYVWLKRALFSSWPELAITSEPNGLQEKSEEIIVKKGGTSSNDPRNRAHYDRLITKAFAEARRVVRTDGVVTIVFGHGEIEVWERLLTALWDAGLVLTGSWPAKTEKGGKVGFSNIVTTLTMACRPAPPNRLDGRRAAVESEVKSEVRSRIHLWERSGLAPTDMLMAAVGPAMEVVGRYARVLDKAAEPVAISTFLPLARTAVQEAMAFEIEHHPLETFDARTRFALWWVRLFGRQVTAKSELRWQALASSMSLADVHDLVPDADKGCRFVTASDFVAPITPESSVIDVVLGMALAQENGLLAVGELLVAGGRDPDDPYLWATTKFLADRLPDSDPDVIAWTRILRNRSGVGSAAKSAVEARVSADKAHTAEKSQMRLL